MVTFLGAAALAFGAIFVAEFGDKSQLLILAFATRYTARPVILGVVLAAAIIQGVSVGLGGTDGSHRVGRPVRVGRRGGPARSVARLRRATCWKENPCAHRPAPS